MAYIHLKDEDIVPAKEETSEEVLARLAQLKSKLDGVTLGETIETPPSLELKQTHPLGHEILYIAGEPWPGLWVPSWHAHYLKDQGKSRWPMCEEEDPTTGYICTQKKERCEAGWAHAACRLRDPEDEFTADDVCLSIWKTEGQADHHSLQLLDQKYSLCVRPISNYYQPEINDNGVCDEESPWSGRWRCSMPDGHPYSHIACADRTLEIWQS